MYIFRQPLPANDELSARRLVKTIESLIGYRLSSYPLYIANSIGFALFLSTLFFVITFIGYILIESDLDIKKVFINTITDSSQLFVLLFLAWFLNLAGPIWFKRCLACYERSTVIFVGLVSIIALALCVFLSVYYLTPATPEQTSILDESPYVCDEVAGCKTSAGPKTTIEIMRDDSFKAADTSANHSLTSDETQSEEFNKLLAQYGIDDFDLTERVEFIKSNFTGISLKYALNRKKIEDWDAFFLELDSVAATKPAYVRLLITKAINDGASFDVIVEILNRGHTLSTNNISALTSRFNVSELDALENYGIEINDALALAIALRNAEKEEVFDYLLAKDQLVFSNEVDVFREVLERIDILKLDASFALKVLQRGAPVTDKTLVWIEGALKQNNYPLYKALKEELSIQGLG